MDGRLPDNLRLTLDRQQFLEDERGHRSLEQWLSTPESAYPDSLADGFDSYQDFDERAGPYLG